MDTDRAINLVNETISYKPGWELYARDFTSRHQATICLYVEGVSYETRQSDAKCGYPQPNRPRAAFMIPVRDLDEIGLYRAVMEALIDFEAHEAREFFRILPNMDGPFNPHMIDGQNAWGNPEHDRYFGFNAMAWQ